MHMTDFEISKLNATIDSAVIPCSLSEQNSIRSITNTKEITAKYIGEGKYFLVTDPGGLFLFTVLCGGSLILQQQQQNFMMAVTHELKTPISVAKLNLETLQKYSPGSRKTKKTDPDHTERNITA